MGFSSWLTGDTRESVTCVHSEHGARPVYLTQPGGLASILEPAYEGYGRIAGQLAMEWVGLFNMPPGTTAEPGVDLPFPSVPVEGRPLRVLSMEEIRAVGACLMDGTYYLDVETGAKIAKFDKGAPIIDPEIVNSTTFYGSPLEGYGGQTLDELVASGRLVERDFRGTYPHTLRLSFDPDAVYEEIGESVFCPNQGLAPVTPDQIPR